MIRCTLKLWKKPVVISGGDGVISIELKIDWTNVSFGLMFVKTNVQNGNSPKICSLTISYKHD